jgi:hypothetical protein
VDYMKEASMEKTGLPEMLLDLEAHMVKEHQATAIWLYLELEFCDTVESIIKRNGFQVHHAKMKPEQNG